MHRLETEVVDLSPPGADRYSAVAYLRLKCARLVDKAASSSSIDVVRPPLLDDIGLGVREAAATAPKSESAIEAFAPPNTPPHTQDGQWHRFDGISVIADSLADEVAQCFAELRDALAAHSLAFEHLAHIDLALADMAEFAAVNAAYAVHFPLGSPPTRAAVGLNLAAGRRVQLGAWACDAPDRHALHVQSLSYWAPANIGPYSQAVGVGGRLFLAGQIGLVPASLALPASLDDQLALSSQHVRRIAAAAASDATLAECVCWLVDDDHLAAAEAAWRAWRPADPTVDCVFRRAKQLPRGALVEWQCVYAVREEHA